MALAEVKLQQLSCLSEQIFGNLCRPLLLYGPNAVATHQDYLR
jgi:hypothetical protein